MKFLFVFSIFFASSPLSLARDLSLIYQNNRGVDYFKKEKRLEAFEQFLGLTAQDPTDVQIKFNMASSLQALGEEEKSIQLHKDILKDLDELIKKTKDEGERKELLKLRFAALYNIAVSNQVMQNVEEALSYYQNALEIVPTSKEIKINIEMLFASGGGKGKDKNKDKNKEKSQPQEGESDPQESDEQKGEEKDEKPKDKKDQKEQSQQKPQKEFDQKYMSNEDLKRIMEELKEQEQTIRAKMNRKGGKSAPKDKEW